MKPVLQALVLAERVYEDVSGKKIICGTFNLVLFKEGNAGKQEELPDGSKVSRLIGGVHGGSPYAYISLTDIHVCCDLELQFVNLTKNVVLLTSRVTVKSDNRLETAEVVVALPLLPIREAGIFAFEVVCEGEILGSHRIIAKEMPDTPAIED